MLKRRPKRKPRAGSCNSNFYYDPNDERSLTGGVGDSVLNGQNDSDCGTEPVQKTRRTAKRRPAPKKAYKKLTGLKHPRDEFSVESITFAKNSCISTQRRVRMFFYHNGRRLLSQGKDHTAGQLLEPLIRSCTSFTHPFLSIFRVAEEMYERLANLRYSLHRLALYKGFLTMAPRQLADEISWLALRLLLNRGEGGQVAPFLQTVDDRLSAAFRSCFLALGLFGDACRSLYKTKSIKVIRKLIDEGIMALAKKSLLPPLPVLRLFLFINQSEHLKCRAIMKDFLRGNLESCACLEFAVLLQQMRVFQVLALEDPAERNRYLKDDLHRLYNNCVQYILHSKGELGSLLIVLDVWQLLDFKTRIDVIRCFMEAALHQTFGWRLLFIELYAPINVHPFVEQLFPSKPSHPETRVKLSFDSEARKIFQRVLFLPQVSAIQMLAPEARVFVFLCSAAFDSTSLVSFRRLAILTSLSFDPPRRIVKGSTSSLQSVTRGRRCTVDESNCPNEMTDDSQATFYIRNGAIESTDGLWNRIIVAAKLCRGFCRAGVKVKWQRRLRLDAHKNDIGGGLTDDRSCFSGWNGQIAATTTCISETRNICSHRSEGAKEATKSEISFGGSVSKKYFNLRKRSVLVKLVFADDGIGVSRDADVCVLQEHGQPCINLGKVWIPCNYDILGVDYFELFSLLVSSLALTEIPDSRRVFSCSS